MQPYWFPYIGYFQIMFLVDKFILLDDVSFINKGWINRNRILVNGQPVYITMPLNNASQNRLIREIEIIEDKKWRSKILKTIEMSYKKAPYFDGVFDLIKQVINYGDSDLSLSIYHCLKLVKEYLNIDAEIVKTSSVYPKQNLKSQNRILDICQREKAKTFYNTSAGMDLYDKSLFEQNNIEFHFVKTLPTTYLQLFTKEFTPFLSIIDVMMNNSVDEIENMFNEFTLE